MNPEKESADKAARKQYFTKVKEDFPDVLAFGEQKFHKRMSMRYGENPGYPAAFYAEENAFGANMAALEVLQEGSKGGGINALTGGSSDSFFGKNGGLTRDAMLYRATRFCAIVFFVVTIVVYGLDVYMA